MDFTLYETLERLTPGSLRRRRIVSLRRVLWQLKSVPEPTLHRLHHRSAQRRFSIQAVRLPRDARSHLVAGRLALWLKPHHLT